ncbi:MAG: hypothetical protein NWF08_04050 [Candidatus Bathyarchaeota archaeon]|nr:hypothetical protein [Candidatus Bathyarchaeota archaeon]
MLKDKDQYSLHRTIIILLLLYIIFVTGDIITTTWLIYNDPAGIANEANPLAASLYLKFGVLGLILGKMIFFIPFSIIVINSENRYQKIKWFRQASEAIVLGLITFSLIIFLNNIIAMITISILKGVPYLLTLLQAMVFLTIILAIIIEGIILNHYNLMNHVIFLQIIIGTLLVITPLLLSHNTFFLLLKNPILFIGYILSTLIILGTAFYLTDEIIRYRKSL